MIAVIDYGMGNLRSVEKALEYCFIPCFISSDPEKIRNADGIIIPGVGAFPDAMENMRRKGLDEAIKAFAALGKPVLGICLGMQVLFDAGEEMERCEGLGLLRGVIKRIEGRVKVPHMGWNTLKYTLPSPLLSGIEEESRVYFVHSFYAELGEENILNSYTIYGGRIPALVSRGNVFGMQFHPEKSGDAGIRMLKNFGELIG